MILLGCIMYAMAKADLIYGFIVVVMIFILYWICLLYGYISDRLKRIEEKITK
jgi:hypothetical protein